MSTDLVLSGRYEVQHLLGRGGMAEVHAGLDRTLDRRVAIKLLLPQYRTDEQFVERFRREAQAAASLNHPNVVAVYDTGEHDGLPYIVMELVRGRSLQQIVAAGGLLEDRALEVCADVCAAIGYAHERGLVHRDVKPGNILIAEGGDVKVTDFGIARAIHTDNITQTAAVLGTAAYLSPEQAQGQEVDSRSDIYSLGTVLYEVLTGRQPFLGDTPVGVAYQHVQENPIAPRDLDPTIGVAAEAIALRALAKNPTNRYQTAAEMRDDLMRARVGDAISAPAVLRADETAILDAIPVTNSTRSATAHRRRRAVTYAVLGLLSLAAAAGIVVYLLSLFGGDSSPRVSVPSVINMTYDEAEATLGARGLLARYGGDVFTDDIEVLRVGRQQPPAGASVEDGSIIEVFISRGREVIAVPDVVGMTEEEALAELRRNNLVVTERTTEFSDEFEKGVVLSTDPRAGERIPKGSQVAIVVSAGEDIVAVANVELLTEADARFKLDEQEFKVLVTREFSNDVEKGRVIRQEPAPGTQLPRGSEVTIVISDGRQAPPSPSPSPSPTVLPPSPTPSPSPSPSPTGT